MTNEEKERVFSGLRNMRTKPDYLLYIDGITDLTCDCEFISDIKVLHTTGVNDSFDVIPNCKFIPLWINEFEAAIIERRRFIDGYEEL